MQGEKSVIKALNNVLAGELIAINQTFLHARMAKNWGYGRLNRAIYHESIAAMKRADAVIERTLFLEGLPNLQKLGKLLIGEDPKEMLSCDLEFYTGHQATVRTAIAECETVADYVSRDLLTEQLEDIEEHIDWLETQQTLIHDLGLANYLQSQAAHDE